MTQLDVVKEKLHKSVEEVATLTEKCTNSAEFDELKKELDESKKQAHDQQVTHEEVEGAYSPETKDSGDRFKGNSQGRSQTQGRPQRVRET